MATEKYVPYKGVFGSSSVIEATLDWFENSSELNFLWVFPNGDTEMMSMNAASRAGKVVVNGNVVKISALTNYGTASECVFVYRSTMLKTKAMQVYEGVIPLSAILAELEEVRRAAEDAKTEAAKSLRVPEWSEVETHFPDKASRANKVMGFDGDGNPTTGEDCKQIKDIVDAGKQCQVSVEQAAAQASEAKRQAEIAGTHAHDANDSVVECVELLEEAELEANKAKTYAEKAASNGADAVNKARIAANEAMLANEQAQHAKEEVLAAKEDVAVKTQDLNKAVCYVACAASKVEERVEAAKQDIDATKQAAVGEIEAFTDVYKKTETYSKAQIDGVDTGAEVVLKMNEIIAQLKDYEEVTGEKLPFDFWEAVMAEFQRWQENPNKTYEWSSTTPYEGAEKVIVDFLVKKTTMNSYTAKTARIAFLPYSVVTEGAFSYSDCEVVIAPNATSVASLMRNSKCRQPVYFRNAQYCDTLLAYTDFDNFAVLPKCSSAANSFVYTKMSAKNIAKTLDYLPAWGSGTHRISFSGSSGAAHVSTTETLTVEVDGTTYTFENFPKYTTDDENETLRYAVARAAAKGWTVQMGDPAGDVVKPTA